MLIWMCGVTRLDGIKNEDIRRKVRVVDIIKDIKIKKI